MSIAWVRPFQLTATQQQDHGAGRQICRNVWSASSTQKLTHICVLPKWLNWYLAFIPLRLHINSQSDISCSSFVLVKKMGTPNPTWRIINLVIHGFILKHWFLQRTDGEEFSHFHTQLLTSGELQGLVQTACISFQQCRITPILLARTVWLFFKWTWMLYLLFSFPLQLPTGSTFNKEGFSCLRHTNLQTSLHQQTYTSSTRITTQMNCFQPFDLLLNCCCCDCSPCQCTPEFEVTKFCQKMVFCGATSVLCTTCEIWEVFVKGI